MNPDGPTVWIPSFAVKDGVLPRRGTMKIRRTIQSAPPWTNNTPPNFCIRSRDFHCSGRSFPLAAFITTTNKFRCQPGEKRMVCREVERKSLLSTNLHWQPNLVFLVSLHLCAENFHPKPDEPDTKRERIKPSAWARVVYEQAMPAIRPVLANAV